MLKYKIVKGSNNISIPINNINISLKDEPKIDEPKIKESVSREKSVYRNTIPYSIEFYFKMLDGTYKRSLTEFFNFKDEMFRNVFKKSNLIFEFYEKGETFSWLYSESIPLTSGLYKPERKETNPKTLKTVILSAEVEPYFTFDVNSTYMSELYFYRDFKNFKNIINGEAVIFMRCIMQNAKNGTREYFHTNGVLTPSTDYSFYQEIRVKPDGTFYFIKKTGGISNNITFTQIS